jgi:hypothetical protein
MRLPALALLGLACSVALAPACGRKKTRRGERSAPGDAMPGDAGAARRAPVPDRIEGTLTLDDAPLAIAACRPGRDPALYVDLVTAVGALRFVSGEAERMFWNPRPAANTRGEAIACSIPHRSWGGGNRADGAAYFRGELAFSCRGAPGALEGKVSLDCGDIRPDERAGLDDQRHRLRDEQDRAGSGSGPGSGSGAGSGAQPP